MDSPSGTYVYFPKVSVSGTVQHSEIVWISMWIVSPSESENNSTKTSVRALSVEHISTFRLDLPTPIYKNYP